MKKIIRMLTDDHLQIIESINEMRSLLKNGSKVSLMKIFDIFSFFEEFTSKEHHQREERVLYTWMLMQNENSDSSLIRKIIAEHEFFENKINEIKGMLTSFLNVNNNQTPTSLLYEIEMFIVKYEEHIEKEEKFIFEIADGLKISEDETLELVEKMSTL